MKKNLQGQACWCKAKDSVAFARVVRVELLIQLEERVKQGCFKRVCTKFRKEAKSYKHTQTLTLQAVEEAVYLITCY